MVAHARKDIVVSDEVSIYHCCCRCVRRAYLCGLDSLTGNDYSYRRQWVRERLENLAACFAVDVATYCVMENHIHVILRIRPDLVASWSDEEVVRRWLRLSSKKIELRDVKQKRFDAALADPETIVRYRIHLSSLSRFMWYLNEPIARRANGEDDCTGRFFEERFRSTRLLDETSLLACSLYVDLNPIRAMMAETPEQSSFTSAADRIADRMAWMEAIEDAQEKTLSGWLAPILIDGDGYAGAAAGRRASDKGLFDFSSDYYLKLLDWTGRQIRDDKRGAIPRDLEPIFDRLHLHEELWVDRVISFGHQSGRVAGHSSTRHDVPDDAELVWE